MTNGEKKKLQIEKFFSEVTSKFTFSPQNKQYLLFRTILLIVAVCLICINWYVFDRKNNYRIGYTSARTYFALTSARYEDRAATLELRQRAAARIVDVMVQDEKIATEVNKRLDLLESNDYKSLFNQPLTELMNKLPDSSRKTIVKSVLDIGRKIRDEASSSEQQTSLIWKYLRKIPMSQADKNIAFQMLDTILNPSLQSDAEMTSRLREDVSVQIPAVIREIRPGAVLVQKGQVVTPALAKLLESQGYPDAAFPLKHLIFILLVIIAWSFWPVWIENGLKEKLSLREWIYIAVVLSLVWTFELIFARFSGYSMAVLGLTGWLCLTLPISLSYHIIFGGGIISVLIAFGTNPGIVALGCILASFSAGIGRILFVDPPNHRMTIWKNLFFLGICLGVVSVCIH